MDNPGGGPSSSQQPAGGDEEPMKGLPWQVQKVKGGQLHIAIAGLEELCVSKKPERVTGRGPFQNCCLEAGNALVGDWRGKEFSKVTQYRLNSKLPPVDDEAMRELEGRLRCICDGRNVDIIMAARSGSEPRLFVQQLVICPQLLAAIPDDHVQECLRVVDATWPQLMDFINNPANKDRLKRLGHKAAFGNRAFNEAVDTLFYVTAGVAAEAAQGEKARNEVISKWTGSTWDIADPNDRYSTWNGRLTTWANTKTAEQTLLTAAGHHAAVVKLSKGECAHAIVVGTAPGHTSTVCPVPLPQLLVTAYDWLMLDKKVVLCDYALLQGGGVMEGMEAFVTAVRKGLKYEGASPEQVVSRQDVEEFLAANFLVTDSSICAGAVGLASQYRWVWQVPLLVPPGYKVSSSRQAEADAPPDDATPPAKVSPLVFLLVWVFGAARCVSYVLQNAEAVKRGDVMLLCGAGASVLRSGTTHSASEGGTTPEGPLWLHALLASTCRQMVALVAGSDPGLAKVLMVRLSEVLAEGPGAYRGFEVPTLLEELPPANFLIFLYHHVKAAIAAGVTNTDLFPELLDILKELISFTDVRPFLEEMCAEVNRLELVVHGRVGTGKPPLRFFHKSLGYRLNLLKQRVASHSAALQQEELQELVWLEESFKLLEANQVPPPEDYMNVLVDKYRELSGWADIHLHVPLEKLVEGLQVDAAAASQKRRRGPNHTSDSDRQLQEDRFGNRGRLESGSGGGAVPAGGKSFVTDAMRAIGLQQTGAAGGQPAAPVLASVPDALASAAEDMVHGYVNGNPSERLESAGRSRLERALRLGEGVGQAEGEAERQAAVLQELSEVPAARLGRIAAVAAGKILEDERLEPAKRKVRKALLEIVVGMTQELGDGDGDGAA